MPVFRIDRRNGEDVGHLGKFFVLLNQLDHFIELFVVELLTALMLVRSLGSGRHILDEKLQFAGEFSRALELNAVLEPLIKRESVAQIQDRALKSRALNRFEFVGLIALFLDLFQERRELSEAEIFSLTLFPTEQTEHLVVLNEKNRMLIGAWRIEENIDQPFDRAQCASVFQPQFLFAVNNQERVARNRVERFDSAAYQHRKFSELR